MFLGWFKCNKWLKYISFKWFYKYILCIIQRLMSCRRFFSMHYLFNDPHRIHAFLKFGGKKRRCGPFDVRKHSITSVREWLLMSSCQLNRWLKVTTFIEFLILVGQKFLRARKSAWIVKKGGTTVGHIPESLCQPCDIVIQRKQYCSDTVWNYRRSSICCRRGGGLEIPCIYHLFGTREKKDLCVPL